MKDLERIKELEEEIKNLKEQLNETQRDFAMQYNLLDTEYLSDDIMEYADQNTSVYYSDQRAYFEKDTQRATEALKELGYTLDQFDDLDDAICKAGACAEYLDIEEELYEENRLEELQETMQELQELENEEE